MLHLLGGILVIGGMTGFGCLYLEKERKRLLELTGLAYLFKLLRSEITYKKQSLPYACESAGSKIPGLEGRVLEEISREMEKADGRRFGEIWRDKWGRYLGTSFLLRAEKEKVMEFSSFIGYEEEELQEDMVVVFLEQFLELAKRGKEEFEKKKRVVLVLSSCMGILFVLILL